MTTMRAAAFLRAGILAALAGTTFWACGGIAKIDPEGTGGSSSSSSSSSSTSSSSSSTGTPPSLCKQVCDLQAKLGCPIQPNCAADCQSLFGQGCDPQVTALIDCYLTNPPPLCDAPPDLCTDETNAYLACMQPPSSCTDVSCFGNETGCGCKGTCFGSVVETDCTGATCQCKQNGLLVGTCSGPDGDCDPGAGCCSQFWFAPE